MVVCIFCRGVVVFEEQIEKGICPHCGKTNADLQGMTKEEIAALVQDQIFVKESSMTFPQTDKLADRNTKVETRLENGSYVTFVTSLDGTVEVFRSAPVPTTREAEVNHLTSVKRATDGSVAYYETVIEGD